MRSGFTFVLNGTVSGTGTIASEAGNAALTLSGTGNMGTINLNSGAQTFTTLDVNIGGANPQVTFNGNLTLSSPFVLTNGIINMNDNIVNYSSGNVSPMQTLGPQTSYFTFLGPNGGLQWTMNSLGAGTYRWPIGSSGVVSGFRPVTIQTTTTASNPANVKLGFINLDGSGTYSATNIPNSGGNVNANYIANLTLQGNIGGSGNSPNLTMEYQNSDFNTTPSSVSNVKIWYYYVPVGNGTSKWTSTGAQSANTTDGFKHNDS